MNNIEELANQVASRSPRRVLLQLPEGLKMKATEIMDAIAENGIEVFLSAEPCYGACDLPVNEAKQLRCDLIAHVGHSKFYKSIDSKIPVIYYPWKLNIRIDNIDFSIIKEKRIGLVTTAQHLDLLPVMKEMLEKERIDANGVKQLRKKAFVGGKILGCWTANAEKIAGRVDAFLFIGSGSFHPLALKSTDALCASNALGKKLYALDLEKMKIRDMSKEALLFERKRYARIFKAKDAKTFGILVSSKAGQLNLAEAERIKKRLEQRDKKAYILVMDKITDENLYLGIDAFVNTACPRISEDRFSKPVINAEDVDKVLEG